LGKLLDVETREPVFEQESLKEEPAKKFEIDLLDVLLVLAQRKRRILRNTLGVMVVTGIVLLFIRNRYDATAVILPPRQEQSISGLLSGQIGALSALGGASLSSGLLKNPNDIYAGLLQSRTVTSHMVNRFHLKDYYKVKYEEDAIKALLAHTKIDLTKDNLIHITVTTFDSNFSSQLANAYVDELHDLNTNLALTDSSQRRAFFQEQIDREKVALSKAEADFQEMQKKTGLLLPNSQADMMARNIASLRAEITVREAEMEALKNYATEQNPNYQRLSSQIGSLRQQLAQLENSQKASTPGDIELPTAKLPAASQEYMRRYRELRLHEAVYQLLVKQFEAAKIDEAKSAPMIQVVDPAVPMKHKSSPFRTLITLVIGFLTFIFTSAWYVFSYGYRVIAEKDPVFATKASELRSAFFRLRRR
jgi:capsule polysaccharide export protein KpsE/RkpR